MENIQQIENLEEEDEKNCLPYGDRYRELIHTEGIVKNLYKRNPKKKINSELRRIVFCVHFTLTGRPGEKRSYTKLTEETALLVGISSKSVLAILNENPNKPTPKKPQNRPSPVTGVDSFTLVAIKNVIYDMKKRGAHVTLKTVLVTLKERDIFKGGLTSMHKLLVSDELHFVYRKSDFRDRLKHTPEIVAWKRAFLKKYKKLKQAGWHFIFLDETWIFQYGSNTKYAWFDGSVESAAKLRASNGRRYIILHAGGMDGFVPGASLIFPSKIAHLDYHGDMSADYFIKWTVEQLLPNIQHKKTCIVMDNASYHSTELEKRPVQSRSKGELKQWLDDHGIPYENNLKKKELLDICFKNTTNEKCFVFDYLMEKNGYLVLRNAPYHCNFNPIEHIWSTAKSQFNKLITEEQESHTKEVVIQTWERALSKISPTSWPKSVVHCEEEMEKEFDAEKLTLADTPKRVIVSLHDTDSEEETEAAEAFRAAAETKRKDILLERRLAEMKASVEAKKPKRKPAKRKLSLGINNDQQQENIMSIDIDTNEETLATTVTQ